MYSQSRRAQSGRGPRFSPSFSEYAAFATRRLTGFCWAAAQAGRENENESESERERERERSVYVACV